MADKQRARAESAREELLQLLGNRSVHELDAAEEARYFDLLTRVREALNGSDTGLLEDLARRGHPIAGEDEAGRVVVRRRAP